MRIEFTLAGVSPSSCTTSRPDSTREVLSAVRSQRLRQRRAVTAPTSTTSGSRSSGVSSPSISALTASPRLPAAALRAMIEAGARKVRQGPQVRGGLLIEPEVSFRYDVGRYGETLEKLVMTAQFTVPVVVASQSILRTSGEVRLPVVGGRGGRRRRGAGGQGAVDVVAGAGRPAHRPGRLAAGEERFLRPVRRRGRDRADRRGGGETSPPGPAPVFSREARQGAAARGGLTGLRLPPSDARVARSGCRSPCRGVAWHGGTGHGMAWLGAAWRGRDVFYRASWLNPGWFSARSGRVLGTGRAIGGGNGVRPRERSCVRPIYIWKARGAAAPLEPRRRSGGDCCAGRGRTARPPRRALTSLRRIPLRSGGAAGVFGARATSGWARALAHCYATRNRCYLGSDNETAPMRTRLPRGCPAAPLKRPVSGSTMARNGRLPRGSPRGLIEQSRQPCTTPI